MKREEAVLRRLIREQAGAEEAQEEQFKWAINSIKGIDSLPQRVKLFVQSAIEKVLEPGSSAHDTFTQWLETHKDYLDAARKGDVDAIRSKLKPILLKKQKQIASLSSEADSPPSAPPTYKSKPAQKGAQQPDEPLKTLNRLLDLHFLSRIPSPAITALNLPDTALSTLIAVILSLVARTPAAGDE